MQITEFPERAYAAIQLATTHEPARPSIGDIVLYALPDGRNVGQVRPAFVVRCWIADVVNLQVFTDGINDYPSEHLGSHGTLWKTSVHYSENKEPGTWHWRSGE
jgi:hypothetical protein